MQSWSVLVAEDEDEMRRLLVRALGKQGYEVTEIEDGFELHDYMECLERGEVKRPDLVVTDVRMPGRTGLDVVEQLRRVDPRIQVVVMTAFPDDELRARARRLGAALVLEKPFDIDELCAVVRSLLPALQPKTCAS